MDRAKISAYAKTSCRAVRGKRFRVRTFTSKAITNKKSIDKFRFEKHATYGRPPRPLCQGGGGAEHCMRFACARRWLIAGAVRWQSALARPESQFELLEPYASIRTA